MHQKMHIPQTDGRYQNGKNDIFSEVIILKYLLDKEDFRNFYNVLVKCMKKKLPYKEILQIMGFPPEWKSILRIKC